MATYDLLMYSRGDLGINSGNFIGASIGTGNRFTASATAKPSSVVITDNDSAPTMFNDGVPGNIGANPTQQLLTGDLDGQVFTNATTNIEDGFQIRDSSGAIVGNMWTVYSRNSNSFADLQGFVSDFRLVPGETYTTTRTSGGPNINYNTLLVCFGAGTLIRTGDGDCAVEALKVGDLVQSRDHGLQPIRWINSRLVDGAMLRDNPQMRPIRIAKGALGAGTPSQDLIVSPQHRVLVRSHIAQRMFGTMEVLVAAKQLVMLDGIEQADDVEQVEYVHFLCDDHQIVLSNGAETESLYTGQQSLRAVGPAARAEIFALFPELQDTDRAVAPESARMLVSGRRARQLAMRHDKNDQPLIAA